MHDDEEPEGAAEALLGLLMDFGVYKGNTLKRTQLARRCTSMGMTADDVNWLHQHFLGAEKRMGDVTGYVFAKLSKGNDWQVLLRDIRHVSERTGAGTPGKVELEDAAQQEIRLQREFVVAVIQERRTIEWCMAREKVSRSMILKWLVADAPYVIQESWYEGPEHWDELEKGFAENWRRHDEADIIKQERVALFKAAHERKAARRRASGTPPPPLFVGDPAADPEDMVPGDMML